MRCALCDRTIEKYDPALHHLVIDDAHAADICDACTDACIKWNGAKIAKLFPTKTMKRIYDKK